MTGQITPFEFVDVKQEIKVENEALGPTSSVFSPIWDDVPYRTFSLSLSEPKEDPELTQMTSMDKDDQGTIAPPPLCNNEVMGIQLLNLNVKSEVKTNERTHTEKKTYNCEMCNKNFAQAIHLIKHRRIHTGEKPYKCNLCEKKFSDSSNLRRHQRAHTGEKPYKCFICNASFAHASTVKAHRRIHTKEKPYKCEICNKNFAQISTLKQHQTTHQGDRPYKCDFCERKFSVSSRLNTHRKIHTREKLYKFVV